MADYEVFRGKFYGPGQTRGNSITWDGEIWRYTDTGQPILGAGGEDRPCTVCGKLAGEDGKDPCLINLPDEVESACFLARSSVASFRAFSISIIRSIWRVTLPSQVSQLNPHLLHPSIQPSQSCLGTSSNLGLYCV